MKLIKAQEIFFATDLNIRGRKVRKKNSGYLTQFSIKCLYTKLKVITLANHKGNSNPPPPEVVSCSRHEARETYGFGFN